MFHQDGKVTATVGMDTTVTVITAITVIMDTMDGDTTTVTVTTATTAMATTVITVIMITDTMVIMDITNLSNLASSLYHMFLSICIKKPKNVHQLDSCLKKLFFITILKNVRPQKKFSINKFNLNVKCSMLFCYKQINKVGPLTANHNTNTIIIVKLKRFIIPSTITNVYNSLLIVCDPKLSFSVLDPLSCSTS